jgi:hypothetical protein
MAPIKFISQLLLYANKSYLDMILEGSRKELVINFSSGKIRLLRSTSETCRICIGRLTLSIFSAKLEAA